jgi:hypothetical protein
MILVVVVQLIVDEYGRSHREWDLEGDSTVDGIGQALLVVVDGCLDDVVSKDYHRYADAQEDSRHDIEESDRFGESRYWQPGLEHLLLKVREKSVLVLLLLALLVRRNCLIA